MKVTEQEQFAERVGRDFRWYEKELERRNNIASTLKLIISILLGALAACLTWTIYWWPCR